MAHHDYDVPFIVISLSGSLVWALNYVHWLLSPGCGDLFLVDSWTMPEDRILAAQFSSVYVGVAPLGIPSHIRPTLNYNTTYQPLDKLQQHSQEWLHS